jgi:hypothetical protein
LVPEKSEAAVGYTYSSLGIEYLNYNFNVKAGGALPSSEVYLQYYGGNIEPTCSNDSLLGYHFKGKNISIRYGKTEIADVLLEGEEMAFGKTRKIDLDVVFVKRYQDLYMLVLSGNDREIAVDPDLLCKIKAG